jgi:mannose-6-phosphate isomerase
MLPPRRRQGRSLWRHTPGGATLDRVRLHPLTFTPIFKERVWGGSRLAALGKPLPAGAPIGESWELVDLPEDQSVVASGPLAGVPLGELVRQHRDELLGPAALDGGSFPALVKTIDAAQTLSVQVHPDGAVAARLGGRPKCEAWVILDATPGALLYVGLVEGATRERYRHAVEEGRVEELLVPLAVRAGDLVPIVPGTVHAIGAGVVLAEVQQPSDTTYRVYDWGRVGLDGKPRALHLEQALQSIHFGAPPAAPTPGGVDLGLFALRVLEVGPGRPATLDGRGPRVVVGLEGTTRLATDAGDAVCPRGGVVLVPHACATAQLEADAPARALLATFPPGQ